MTSWKTTVAGVLVAISAIATALVAVFDGDPETAINMEALIAAVMQAAVALGLISARDNDKTSEETGAKNKQFRRGGAKLGMWIACVLLFAGCNTFGLPGAQSKAVIDVDETTYDEAGNANTFKLKFQGQGDADELLQGLRYSATPEGSWDLMVDQDVAGLTSPGSLALAEGYADLARMAPELAEALAPYLGAPEAPGAVDGLLRLVTPLPSGP